MAKILGYGNRNFSIPQCKRFNINYTLILIIICFNLPVSTSLSQFLQDFHYTIGYDDGLISPDNYRVYQDNDGYIWIPSSSGINRFNGKEIIHFTENDGLDNNDVWELQIDQSDKIWCTGYTSSIQYIRGNRIFTVKNKVSKSKLYYSGHIRDTTFFVTERGPNFKRFYVDKDDNLKEYKHPKQSENLIIFGDFTDKGFLIFYSRKNNELIHFNIITQRKTFLPRDLYFPNCHGYRQASIMFELNKSLKNVYSINTVGIKKLTDIFYVGAKSKKLERDDLIFEDRNQNLYVKSSNSIKLYNPLNDSRSKHLILKSISNLFGDLKSIGNITEDIDGNFWITKSRGELVFFTPSSIHKKNIVGFSNLNIFEGATTNNYNYYRTSSNELYLQDNTFFNNSSRIELNDVLRSIQTNNDQIFVLTKNDFFRISTESKTSNYKLQRVFKNYWNVLTFALINDSVVINGNGEMWDFKNTRFIKHLHLPPLIKNLIYFNNRLYYTTGNSLHVTSLVDGKTKTFVGFNRVLGSKEFIILCTKKNGAFILESGKPDHVPLEDIQSVVKSGKNYYLVSNEGLFIYKKLEKRLIKLIDNLVEGFKVNSVSINKNYVLIYTTKGVKSLDKIWCQSQNSQNDFKIKLKNILINGKIETIDISNLMHHENNLQFNFDVLTYQNKGRYYIRYKLPGTQNNWYYSQKPEINLYNLKPGKHQLIIQLGTHKFDQFSKELSYEFTIHKPYYFGTPFIVSVVVLFLLLFYLLFLIFTYFRERRNRIKNRLKNLELKILRAQLNPHFIFNAMNSLQGLILTKSDLEINKFISSFSKILRKVLDGGSDEFTTIKEEVEFIKNYIFLENTNFRDPIKLEIRIDERIDTIGFKIPVMLVQPYIENCIQHAFPSQYKDKRVTLDFNYNEVSRKLKITIQDNGIGIEKASKERQKDQHKFHSSQLLKEKAQLLNQLEKDTLTIDILDLSKYPGKQGTKVTIEIRVNS